MALKIFADTNIIIDFIEQRPYDLLHVNKLFEYAEENLINIIVSESVITNALYITGLLSQIAKLLHLVSVVCIDIETFKKAFKDKEDGILYYGAFQVNAQYFVTRNKKDFSGYSLKQLPVVSPKELINSLTFK